MSSFTQFLNENKDLPVLIDVPNSDFVLLRKNSKSFTPYKRFADGSLHPIRGKNKNGQLVWRTYKSMEDAKADLIG